MSGKYRIYSIDDDGLSVRTEEGFEFGEMQTLVASKGQMDRDAFVRTAMRITGRKIEEMRIDNDCDVPEGWKDKCDFKGIVEKHVGSAFLKQVPDFEAGYGFVTVIEEAREGEKPDTFGEIRAHEEWMASLDGITESVIQAFC